MTQSYKAEADFTEPNSRFQFAMRELGPIAASALESHRASVQPRPLSEVRDRLQALLQTTLDIEEQLAIFQNEITGSISFDAIAYRNEKENLSINQGEIKGHQVSFNLMTQGDKVGAISFSRHRRFGKMEVKLLEEASSTLIYPIRNALRYREALKSATTDTLTQVGNRLALESELQKEIDISCRYNQPLSIMMIDIDRFKSVNDLHGHAAGDTVLKHVAATLSDTCRQADATYRYGGEEFVIVMTNTNHAGACTIAERVRATIAGLSCIYGEKEIPITISLGIATLLKNETRPHLFERADKALYLAKQSGRNKAISGQPPE